MWISHWAWICKVCRLDLLVLSKGLHHFPRFSFYLRLFWRHIQRFWSDLCQKKFILCDTRKWWSCWVIFWLTDTINGFHHSHSIKSYTSNQYFWSRNMHEMFTRTIVFTIKKIEKNLLPYLISLIIWIKISLEKLALFLICRN